jgi:TRAP-type C4-dicarboxylate transport system permease large subunit
MPESIFFFVMLLSFIFFAAVKIPISVSLMFSAVCGAFASGHFFPIRQLVEGSFGYFDAILIIATAMIFMESIRVSGLLEDFAQRIAGKFKSRPLFLLMIMTLFIMSAGMITGSSSAAVLTTGAISYPVLKDLGLDKRRAGALIAMAAIFGMIAPPINIPAMIIGQGVDMPYIGFTTPLLLLTVPLAILTAVLIGVKQVKKIENHQLKVMEPISKKWMLYIPVVILIVLMIMENVSRFSLGLPLVFLLCALIASLIGKKNFLSITVKALKESINILSILIGVGMFIQIMTLNGTRGLIVDFLNNLPDMALILGIAFGVPLFGAVSSYGSASVLGVPFLLAFLGNNDIMVCAALSLLAGLGDMVPPTALAGIFAAHVVDEKNYFKVWIKALPSFFITMLAGTLALYYSDEIANLANSNLFYPVFLGVIILISASFLIIDKKRYRSDAL